jgi:hypothetical protein
MVTVPPTRIWAIVFAILGGALLAKGRILPGVILTLIALALIYAWHRSGRGRGQDGLF